MNSYLVRSGNLRKRLTFQVKSTTQDELGQELNIWADLFTCWGEISPLSGRELIAAAAVQSSVTHTITVRYRAELANPQAVAAMRVKYRNRVFDIHAGLNEDERNRVVTLQAEEGLNHG
ncbi:phage head closure protein [Cupriavidus sp. YAF13]|uniref:phage head closure protein n=1 Tax=Cupriavidus sp. YAF13 TaxID=3233075 RepID=UPI003F8DB57B